jgi:hypothetical protein
MPRGGSKPGERRGGRAKGTPNKQSIPAIKAAIVRAHGPKLDSLSLARLAAAGVLAEINKLLATEKYKPAEVVDWYVKLGRIVEGYISYEHPRVSPVERDDRHDYNVRVQADLSRLNTDQLIALKQLALIASGGRTKTISAAPDRPDGSHDQRKAGRGGAGEDSPVTSKSYTGSRTVAAACLTSSSSARAGLGTIGSPVVRAGAMNRGPTRPTPQMFPFKHCGPS